MKQDFKNKVIFQMIALLSITFMTIYSISSIIIVAMKDYKTRSYFFGIVIWCVVIGVIQVGYLTYSIIKNFKQKQPFYYLLSIQASSSTIIAMILCMTEYFVYRAWYRQMEISGAWNAAVTYSLLSIVLGLFLANWILTGFILHKTKPVEDLEEDIL